MNFDTSNFYDAAREKRWEHFTKNVRTGELYPEYKDISYKFLIETVLDNTLIYGKRNGLSSLVDSTSVTSPGISSWDKYAFPLVRGIYSKGIGRELVAFQPMQGPSAYIFALGLTRDASYGEGVDTKVRGEYASGKFAKDYSADPGELQNITRELRVGITSTLVEATAKKIIAHWSTELALRLQATMGISAESELNKEMGREISSQIDETIIYDLVNGATAGNVNWSASYGGTEPVNVQAHKMTISDAIIDCNALIMNKIYRPSTFIIGNVSSVARLQKLEQFSADLANPMTGGTVGRQRVGTYQGQYAVYSDPFFPVDNTLLMGYKGTEWSHAGYVYSPWIPYYTTATFTNPRDLSMLKAAMSMQAFTMVNGDCYATITITNS